MWFSCGRDFQPQLSILLIWNCVGNPSHKRNSTPQEIPLPQDGRTYKALPQVKPSYKRNTSYKRDSSHKRYLFYKRTTITMLYHYYSVSHKSLPARCFNGKDMAGHGDPDKCQTRIWRWFGPTMVGGWRGTGTPPYNGFMRYAVIIWVIITGSCMI